MTGFVGVEAIDYTYFESIYLAYKPLDDDGSNGGSSTTTSSTEEIATESAASSVASSILGLSTALALGKLW